MNLSQKTALKRRQALRSTIAVFGSYVFLIVAACLLGTRTVWVDYHPWQIPSLFLGSVTVILSTLGGIGIFKVFKYLIWNPPPFGQYLGIIKKRGYHTMLFVFVGFSLCIAYFVMPEPKSKVETLFELLSKKREDLDGFSEYLESFRTLPKYIESDYVVFGELALEYRLVKQHSHQGYQYYANKFNEYLKHSDKKIRGFALIFCADSLDRMGKPEDALSLYKKATEENFSYYVSWWAYNELGYAAYFEVPRNYKKAKEYWLLSKQNISSKGVNENLAVISEEQGNWEAADQFYRDALGALRENMESNQDAVLAQHEAGLYVNWANMHRLKAKANLNRGESLKKSEDLLNRAYKADRAYLDQYWVGVRLHIESRNFKRARWLLDALSHLQEKGQFYELNRFHYERLGEAYGAWLRLVIDYYDPSQTEPLLTTTDQLQAAIPGWPSDRSFAAKMLLSDVEKSGHTIDEDMELLDINDFCKFAYMNQED